VRSGVLQRVGEQVLGVLGLVQATRDRTPDDQGQPASPVVGDRGEVPVRPARLAVRLGQVTELGSRVRLDRPQRAHRPALADPVTEGQEDPGQPAGLVQPAGQQPGERRGAAQPGPADRVAQLGEEAGGPAEHGVRTREVTRVVVTQARFCSAQACPCRSPAASVTWYAAANRLLAWLSCRQEVGHAEPAHRVGALRGQLGLGGDVRAPAARPRRLAVAPSASCARPTTSSASARHTGSSSALSAIFSP
jgi:hypothetical protein